MCVGFCPLPVEPSPKFQNHDVGDPVEVSVNCTGWFGVGEDGVQPKFATGDVTAAETVIDFVAVLDPAAFVAVSETK